MLEAMKETKQAGEELIGNHRNNIKTGKEI